MGYNEYMRMKLLERMYDNMSDEEKRLFVKLTLQNRNYKEIQKSLEELKAKADANHHSFLTDFGANVAGNAVWDMFVWIGSRLFKRF